MSLVFSRGVVYLLCCLVAIGLVVWMTLVLWVVYCCGCLVHVDYGCGRLFLLAVLALCFSWL